MPIATITSKGQMTLPKEVRDGMRLKPRDQVHVTLLANGAAIIRPKNRSIKDLYGVLHRPGRKPLSIDELSR
jgi:AbrB family looped-hinge helix DNA binding protein